MNSVKYRVAEVAAALIALRDDARPESPAASAWLADALDDVLEAFECLGRGERCSRSLRPWAAPCAAPSAP